jgi:hypothetical protein
MTHHDLISGYIDNELSAVQEQEFLISLAANDNLRNSFRTELTLKNIVHRDESLITPPRALRASVFAAVGMSAAVAPEAIQAAQASAAPSSSTSTFATQSSSFFKTLFATKMNALFTTLSLSVATLVGFVGNDVIKDEPVAAPTVQSESTPATNRVSEPAQAQSTEVVAEKPIGNAPKQTGSRIVTRIKPKTVAPANSISSEDTKPQVDAAADPATTGTGEAEIGEPVISDPKK